MDRGWSIFLIVVGCIFAVFVAWLLTMLVTMYGTSSKKAYDQNLPSQGVLPSGMTWLVLFQHGDFISKSSCPFSMLEFSAVDGDPITMKCVTTLSTIVPEKWASFVHAGDLTAGEGKSLGVSRIAGVFPVFYENMTLVHRIPAQTGRMELAIVTGFHNTKKYIAILSDASYETLDPINSTFNDVDDFLRTAGMPRLYKDELGGDLGDGWSGSALVRSVA